MSNMLNLWHQSNVISSKVNFTFQIKPCPMANASQHSFNLAEFQNYSLWQINKFSWYHVFEYPQLMWDWLCSICWRNWKKKKTILFFPKWRRSSKAEFFSFLGESWLYICSTGTGSADTYCLVVVQIAMQDTWRFVH